MANINPFKMKKAELLEFFTKHCKHGHRYNEHPNCWVKEKQQYPKIGIIDIETTGLAGGDFDTLLCYVIKVYGEDSYYSSILSQEEFYSNSTDKKLVRRCIRDMKRFDKLITYNGIYFDMPFIRTRALIHKIKNFPEYGLIQHADVYQMAKKSMRSPRKSMDVISHLLGIKGKNHVLGKLWRKAKMWADPKAMAYILDHCIRDTKVTEQLYDILKDYSRETKRSI